jgi:thiosulfate reductase cytochrome b subunit
MKTAFFSPKLQEHHQVSKNYNFSHFFGSYNPFEKMAFFGLDPLLLPLQA